MPIEMVGLPTTKLLLERRMKKRQKLLTREGVTQREREREREERK